MKKGGSILGILLVLFAVEAQPVITEQPTNQLVLCGNSANFNVSVSGTGAFTYQWQFNGTNLPTGDHHNCSRQWHRISFLAMGGSATNAAEYTSRCSSGCQQQSFIVDYANNRIQG